MDALLALAPVKLGTGSAPLSFAQERLWLIDNAAPGEATYNVPLFLRWHDRVDVAALETALTALVARHDVLRTTYHLRDARPVQIVGPPSSMPVEVVGAPHDLQAEAARRAREPFDLAAGPVLRCTAFTGMDEGDAVLLTIHHIAFDGWSMSRLCADLAVTYEAARTGESPQLPALELRYADFAARERQMADDPAVRALLSERLNDLRMIQSGLALAGALPRGSGRRVGRRGGEHVVAVPPRLWTGLNEYAVAHRVTPFVVLFSALQMVLRTWSGRDEFLVGTISANRPQTEVEDLVGFFVNTVPLCCRVGPATTFGELCNEVRTESFRSLTYQRIPFDRLSAAARTELVDVGFALQNFPRPDPSAPIRWDQPMVLPTGTAKFDLLLTVEEREGGATATVEHDLDRYTDEIAAAFAQSFADVLNAVLGDPSLTAADLARFAPASVPVRAGPAALPSPASASPGKLIGSQHRAAKLFSAVLDELDGGARGLTAGQFGPGSDFFSLGGHSMLVITMLRQAEAELGIALSARDFLADPTVAGLGRLLAGSRTARSLRHVDEADRHPATAAQQRFWSIDRLPWLRQAYLVPSVVEFDDGIDREKLHDAVQNILRRHPALRSRFRVDRKQRKVFYRTDGLDPSVAVIDGSAWDDAELREHLAGTCWSGFDLAAQSPARAEIISRNDLTVLVLVVHHIVCDGMSLELLLREIRQVYQAGSLLPAAVHPATLVAEPDETVVQAHTDAVIAALTGAPTDVDLPYDRPRQEMQATLAGTVTAALGPERTARLRKIAAEAACTTFMAGAALLAVSLARAGTQRDFLFAFPWSERTGMHSNDAIGMFVDTLVLRVDLRGVCTWLDVLARVRAASISAFGNSTAQFDAVAAAVHPDRDISRPPITPVYLNAHERALSAPESGRLLPLDPLHIKYELELTVVDRQHDLDLNLAYAAGLFDRETAERLLHGLVTAADDLLDQPKARPLEET